MEKTMLASGITDGQIDDLTNKLRDAMRKHRNEFGKDAAQEALRSPNIGMQLLSVFRDLVENISKQIVRRVKVDRTRTPQAVLDATGRTKYVDNKVVTAMPGKGASAGKEDVYFFKLGRFVSDDELEVEYESRGLKAADPYSLAAVNEADPSFADGRPNGTHWKDKSGNWCFAAFGDWRGGRFVNVDRRDSDWGGGWWFAGVRK